VLDEEDSNQTGSIERPSADEGMLTFDMFSETSEDVPIIAQESRKEHAECEVEEGSECEVEEGDDEEGYYISEPNEIFKGRYRVTEPLGKGVFSTVVKAVDLQQERAGGHSVEVAIKILRR
jgi:serine/threonine-protein kinase PRP4